MVRRLAIFLVAAAIVISSGGILCAQTRAAGADGCCRSSCSEMRHGDSMRCCVSHMTQGPSEVAPEHHAAPGMAACSVSTSFVAAPFNPVLPLRVASLMHPPPGHPPSRECLCSLQI